MDPQFIEVMLSVQALSEYTATFGLVVMVPEDDTLLLTVTAAIDKPAKAIAATVKMTAKYFETLAIAMCCFQLSS